MKTIVSTKELTIEEVVNSLQTSNKLIIFYRSNNDRNGVPRFLKRIDNATVAFVSPINNYSNSYEAPTYRGCLEIASKSRKLYVIDKDEADQLFKLQM